MLLGSYIYVICRPGGPYWEKLCPRCSRPRAQFFSNTDLPTPANNVFIFFSLKNYFIRNICVDFLLKQFHTVRVCLTFRSSKHVLVIKYLKVEIKFSLILELSNEGFTFHGDFQSNKKLLKQPQCWKTRSGPYAGSGWENPDRWSARNQPIRFKDLGFRTVEMLQKKIAHSSVNFHIQ